jgi:D-alanyl-D-alanine carboxypeptidase
MYFAYGKIDCWKCHNSLGESHMKKTIAILALILFLTGCSTRGKDISLMQDSSVSVIESLEVVSVAVKDIDDSGYLALVNLQYPIMTELDSEFVKVLDYVPTSPVGIQDMYLHSSAMTAVIEMFDSAREAGITGGLSVASGFRGYDKQQELYGDGNNSDYVLPPGHSEHQTGLAVDIGVQGMAGTEFGSSKQGRWFADNSYRFGLILRYPEKAEAITGINYEPWHFRYVGEVHAYYIKQNNIVLEEYIQLIQNQGGLRLEKDGITYHILHQVPQNGVINIPDGLDFIVSNDNTGGYIVTAW